MSFAQWSLHGGSVQDPLQILHVASQDRSGAVEWLRPVRGAASNNPLESKEALHGQSCKLEPCELEPVGRRRSPSHFLVVDETGCPPPRRRPETTPSTSKECCR